jgi:hypothetical protein
MNILYKQMIWILAGLSSAVLLASCGGGGTGSAGTPLLGSKNTNTATLQWLALGKLNPAYVPMNVPVTVVYTQLDPYQHPVPGQVVTFYTSSPSLVQCYSQTTPPTLNPTCTASTDSNGMAQVIIQAQPLNSAGTIYPSVGFSIQVVTSQVPVTVSPSASKPFQFASAVQYSKQTTLIGSPIGWTFVPLQ